MRYPSVLMVCGALTFMLAGCNTDGQAEPKEPTTQSSTVNQPQTEPNESESLQENSSTVDEGIDEDMPPVHQRPQFAESRNHTSTSGSAVDIEIDGMANLELDTLIFVNKEIALPIDYEPSDLVRANIDFVDSATGERQLLRGEAARAIEGLMLGAKVDGIDLKGTSAYRSYAYQVNLFNAYVERDGKEKAMKYSAPPGHSEHQTGLAIDVSSASVNYQLTQSLGETVEGKWLAEHAHEYGFIIRYQKAFEDETGYMYEPWHLRYIGVQHAKRVFESNQPFDRYIKEYMK
ncbi:D-alanyl-D-alanine carboxypeptidase family protein [Exiguobacterium aestuarii]|uniref:M15 family metallopeptidase n=1 Tax=Exiguobacterium aestuarii TaxID=273527 RepID=UPI001CD660C5|nr:M15 family metallopeptidase [Exiguobacterium aestuarii]MCA0980442.1 M15 family metallopeptidase [Exiguobacterium aestuarii]